MEPKVQCNIQKGSPIIPILSRINPIRLTDTYLFKIQNASRTINFRQNSKKDIELVLHLLRMDDSRWPKEIYQLTPHGRRRRE